MKLPKFTLFTFCCIVFLSCTSCFEQFFDTADPEPVLPPLTQTGANTFGCLVNGEVMVSPNSLRMRVYRTYSPDRLYAISADSGGRDGEDDEDIKFFTSAPNGISEKSYIVRDSTSAGLNTAEYRLKVDSDSRINYYAFDDSGEFQITYLDEEKGIISGVFAFSAVNSQNSDTVHITEGRFDIKF